MKSIFSSLNAKLALAVLAVGTMFASCYDSENGDVTINPQPDPAKYVIAGNLTDAATSAAVSPATTEVRVTIDNVEVTVDENGFFVKEDVGSGSHVVEVIASGYDDAKRTIYLPETADGGIAYGNADFVLYGIGEDDLKEADVPGGTVPAQADAQKFADDQRAVIEQEMASLGLTVVDFVADANGNITLTATGEPASDNLEDGNTVEVKIPVYTGFTSNITGDGKLWATKAITDAQIWNASAAKELNRSYGLQLGEPDTFTIVGVKGLTVVGYTVKAYFESKVLSFEGVEGIVMYQNASTINVSWESHDSHDGHINSHGPHNGAGGGSSM